MSSPTALFLRGEVDLEVVRIVVDVEEAAALVELTDTSGRNSKEDGTRDLQPHAKTHLIPDAFYGHGGEVPLVDPFLQLKSYRRASSDTFTHDQESSQKVKLKATHSAT